MGGSLDTKSRARGGTEDGDGRRRDDAGRGSPHRRCTEGGLCRRGLSCAIRLHRDGPGSCAPRARGGANLWADPEGVPRRLRQVELLLLRTQDTSRIARRAAPMRIWGLTLLLLLE